MGRLEARLRALEGTTDGHARLLPDVVADDTTDSEIERLRRGGRRVYRLSDAVELFV